MKSKHKYFMILIILMSCLFIIPIHADSGWDSSYSPSSGSGSSGGYDSSGGYSSPGRTHSSNSSSSSEYSGIDITEESISEIITISIISGIVLFIIGCLYIILERKIAQISNRLRTNFKIKFDFYNQLEFSHKIANSILLDIDSEQFKLKAFEIYKEIQIAWMNFDYDTLRKYTTDELYNLYHSQLIALKAKKQQNIMSNFTFKSGKIIHVEKTTNNIIVKVQMLVECYDYVVNESKKVIRGTDKRKNIYHYEMTFIKGLNIKNNKCPNCNASLEKVNSSVCPYCDSTIINDNHDYVLSKKQMLNQGQK